MEKKTFYLTTAIAYASRKPHIGNVYEIILADAVARYKRQMGFDVYFLTGTDEHGQKIEDLAKEAGISPKEYVDKVAGEIKDIWNLMGITYDRFIRTTDEDHEKSVKHILHKMFEQDDIYKGSYEGWYCVPCESFFTETQVTDGRCPDCGAEVKRASEEAYFFRMSKYADRLLEYIESHPGFIDPELRQKEMINNFIKPGLQDLCVSRTSFKWGIPLDFDDKHVAYVWLDALSNYITAIGYDVNEQGELYHKYWPADVHIIGKDIMRFHSIYWPIFLMSLGVPLPKKIFGHPWLLFGEDKMSKSKGNVLYADELAKTFGVDGVRYYVLSEMPYASDGSITYSSLITRYNTDLANNLGNLVKRTLDMTAKYFDSVIPSRESAEGTDGELIEAVANGIKEWNECMDTYHIADAAEAVFTMLRRANKYIDETAPWALAKDENARGRLGTVLYNLLETIRIGAVMLTPFIPATAEKIFSQLNTDVTALDFGGLVSGVKTGVAEVLFARVDEKKFYADMGVTAEEASGRAPKKPNEEKKEKREKKCECKECKAKAEGEGEKAEGCLLIGIDDFMNVELRTAQILEAEPVEKSDKLLKLQLDLGYEKRQVVSGIAKYYAPADLIGKKVIVVANLKPAKLRGVESNGMILASGEEDVRVVFLDSDTKLGERIR